MHQCIAKHFNPSRYLYEHATVPLCMFYICRYRHIIISTFGPVYTFHSIPLGVAFHPPPPPPNQKTTIKLCKQLHWFVGAHELVFMREQKALNTWPGRDPIEMPHLITRKSGNFTTTFGNSIQSGHTSPAREVYVTEGLSFMYPGIVSQAIDAAAAAVAAAV